MRTSQCEQCGAAVDVENVLRTSTTRHVDSRHRAGVTLCPDHFVDGLRKLER